MGNQSLRASVMIAVLSMVRSWYFTELACAWETPYSSVVFSLSLFLITFTLLVYRKPELTALLSYKRWAHYTSIMTMG